MERVEGAVEIVVDHGQRIGLGAGGEGHAARFLDTPMAEGRFNALLHKRGSRRFPRGARVPARHLGLDAGQRSCDKL